MELIVFNWQTSHTQEIIGNRFSALKIIGKDVVSMLKNKEKAKHHGDIDSDVVAVFLNITKFRWFIRYICLG